MDGPFSLGSLRNIVWCFKITLNMFYKGRSDLVTSWGFSDFYSRSLKLFFRFSNFMVVL